jgi:hypothetical protein
VRAIQSFREKLAARYAAASLVQLRQRAPGEFGGLRDQVERHLIEMPLPRVQNVGNSRDAFIYDWEKKDFLAATPHVLRWSERLTSKTLAELEIQLRWDSAVDEMRGVARGIYLRLPEDALLWTSGKTFDRPDPAQLLRTLA